MMTRLTPKAAASGASSVSRTPGAEPARGGKCGPVRNNCKQTVDCGSCDCPAPCDTCFVCQGGPNTPGACVPDPEQNGETCGLGRRCNDLGQCVCDGVSCPSGCCDAQGQCQIDNDDTCAASGAPCGTAAVCTGGQVCRGGTCILCSAACPNCDYCLRQINGMSICSDSNALNCNTVPCSLSSCATNQVCTRSFHRIADDETVVIAGACSATAGSGACVASTTC